MSELSQISVAIQKKHLRQSREQALDFCVSLFGCDRSDADKLIIEVLPVASKPNAAFKSDSLVFND